MEYSLLVGLTTKHWNGKYIHPGEVQWIPVFSVALSVLDILTCRQHGSLAVPNTTQMAEKNLHNKLYFRLNGFCVKKASDFSKPLS